MQNIQTAVGFFRTREGFVDREAYTRNLRVIQEALNLVSAAHYPTAISLTGFEMRYAPAASEDIFAAIADETENPHLPFFDAYVEDALRDDAPDLIGISLASESQLIPGLSLARLIRQKLPGTKIVVGGAALTLLADKIRTVPRLFTLFNYLIQFEGETPLMRLCQHLEGECPLTQVPNLLYLENAEVKGTGLQSVEDLDALPTPVYDEFPLEKYLSPLPVLSLEGARGCWWGKCVFCSAPSISRKACRVRRPEKTAADMAYLQARHGASLFSLVNEGLPAEYLSQLAEAILGRGLQVHWCVNARLEQAFTRERLEVIRKAGCCKLYFGLESGSQRVLDLMRKGIRLEGVRGILSACKAAGVDVHLYLMIGFPTESDQERQATQDFVMGHLDAVDRDWVTFNVSVFTPRFNSPILKQLSRLGYRLLAKGERYDLEVAFTHEPTDATTPQFSRDQLTRMANQMAENIANNLPPPRFSLETNHYMYYRALQNGKPILPAIAQPDAQLDTEALFQSGHRFRVSPWVTIRHFKKIDGDSESTAKVSSRLVNKAFAYNLPLDKCYSLNRTAVAFLNGLRRPKSLEEIVGARQTRTAEARRRQAHIVDLLTRGLIEVDAADPV